MGNLLYVIAIILIVFWGIGFFAYNAGSLIHIMLIFAALSILVTAFRGNKTTPESIK